MIDVKLLRENPEDVAKRLESRGVKVDIKKIKKMDDERRTLMKQSEDLKAQKNEASKKIGGEKDAAARKKLIEAAKEFDVDADKIKALLAEIEEQFFTLVREFPNLPLPDVPVGKDDKDNEVLRTVGKPPKFDFEPKDHLELGVALGIIDTERAGKVSGSRFGYLMGDAALLEFALVQYAMHHLVESGFTPVVPPVIIKKSSMAAMGFLEKGGDQEMYYLPQDDSFLVGTSEQSIGPMHMDEILDDTTLPRRYAGFSTCFRREAGAYGKDTHGILRVHQFDKIEMFSYTTPENSNAEHERLLGVEEHLVKGLDLPYRVLKLCTGDMGRASARTYDIECWMPSQNTYRETHSTSNCVDYQARRLNTRMRGKDGKVQLAHTLNGTVFAIGRIIIAIMENNQRADGSIAIPEALHQYMHGKTVITPPKA